MLTASPWPGGARSRWRGKCPGGETIGSRGRSRGSRHGPAVRSRAWRVNARPRQARPGQAITWTAAIRPVIGSVRGATCIMLRRLSGSRQPIQAEMTLWTWTGGHASGGTNATARQAPAGRPSGRCTAIWVRPACLALKTGSWSTLRVVPIASSVRGTPAANALADRKPRSGWRSTRARAVHERPLAKGARGPAVSRPTCTWPSPLAASASARPCGPARARSGPSLQPSARCGGGSTA